jgi:hypothetical protein
MGINKSRGSGIVNAKFNTFYGFLGRSMRSCVAMAYPCFAPTLDEAKGAIMQAPQGIKVLFIAGFGPIVREPASRKLYVDVLGLPLKGEDYLNSNEIEGVKEFALWPLEQAAESCFGQKAWPEHLHVPQAWLEFDVEDIEKASDALKGQGYQLLVSGHTEPWGQTVTRWLSPEGLLLGLSYTPWLRGEGERP